MSARAWLLAGNQGFVDAPERFLVVEVDDGDEFDAVLEGVVGEADGLSPVGQVFELFRRDASGCVHVLGDGDEAAVGAAEGFAFDVDGGEQDVEGFFIRDTHVVGERSGADAREEVR